MRDWSKETTERLTKLLHNRVALILRARYTEVAKESIDKAIQEIAEIEAELSKRHENK